MFVPNFKIIVQVVAEKSLTKKKFTHIHTHTQTEKAKTIYPLYTSYTGGIISPPVPEKIFEEFLPYMGVAAILVM